MDKDRVKGKAKDIAGRVQRQAGEWTGDEESQVKGAAKQVEGKAQHLWGQAKDTVRKSTQESRERIRQVEEERALNSTEREESTKKPRKAA
jgi:uncharacterized protein YjbJ (UPF0337 family)